MADLNEANTLSDSTITGSRDDKPAVLIIGGLGISYIPQESTDGIEVSLIPPYCRLHRPLPRPLHPP